MEPELNQEPQPKQNYFSFLWKNLTTGQKFGIGALLLLLLVFPIAVITVLLPTNPFSKAQFAPATGPNGATSVLYFSKDSTTTYADTHSVYNGQTFPIGVVIDTQLNTVTAAKVKIQYPTNVLDVAAVNLGTYLPTVLEDPVIDEVNGNVSFTIGSEATDPKHGIGTLATITFNATGETASAPITFTSETEVAAIEEDGNVLNFSSPIGITVTQTPSITPTPTETLTPTPTSGPVTPTPTEAPNSADLQIKLKLDTVSSQANDLPIAIALLEQNCGTSCAGIDTTVTASNDSTGEYTALLQNIIVGTGKTFTGSIKPAGFLSKTLGVLNLVPGLNITTVSVNLTPGDIDGNGEVDIYDFTALVEDYGLANNPADFNKNGTVDIYDFTALVEAFGQTGD